MNGQMSTAHKLEEYRLFVEDTARFSDRRQAAHNIQIAIHTLFLGGVAALLARVAEGTTGAALPLLVLALVLLIAALVICAIWCRLTERYKEMIRFRCGQIEEMEKDIPGCHRMICRIREHFEDSSFSDIEANLPRVFMGVYSALVCATLLGLCSTWCRLAEGLGEWIGCS